MTLKTDERGQLKDPPMWVHLVLTVGFVILMMVLQGP